MKWVTGLPHKSHRRSKTPAGRFHESKYFHDGGPDLAQSKKVYEQFVNKGWREEGPFEFDDFPYFEQKYFAVPHWAEES
jgi:hypothetical protein